MMLMLAVTAATVLLVAMVFAAAWEDGTRSPDRVPTWWERHAAGVVWVAGAAVWLGMAIYIMVTQ